jgi:hypothetical protein
VIVVAAPITLISQAFSAMAKERWRGVLDRVPSAFRPWMFSTVLRMTWSRCADLPARSSKQRKKNGPTNSGDLGDFGDVSLR